MAILNVLRAGCVPGNTLADCYIFSLKTVLGTLQVNELSEIDVSG